MLATFRAGQIGKQSLQIAHFAATFHKQIQVGDRVFCLKPE